MYSSQLQLSNVWDGSELVCIVLSPARNFNMLLNDVVVHCAVICDYVPHVATVHATIFYKYILLYIKLYCNSDIIISIFFSFTQYSVQPQMEAVL